MANDFLNTNALVGPIDFTPALQQAGVRLDTSNTTEDITKDKAQLLPEVMVFGENKRDQVRARGPEPLVTNKDLAPPNEFDPREVVLPDDDKLTPGDTPSPSQVKEMGGFFSKLGDVLAQPASRKLMAQLGMSINAARGLPTNIGEFAIAEAEEDARAEFRRQLELGKDPNQIRMRGLSAEGREAVLRERQQAADREREITRQTEQDERAAEQHELAVEGQETQNELSQIDLMLKRQQQAEGPIDPADTLRQGAAVLGVQLPEQVKLDGLTQPVAERLLIDLAMAKRLDKQLSAQQRTQMQEEGRMTPLERATQVAIHGSQFAFLEKQRRQLLSMGEDVPSGSLTALIKEQGNVFNRMIGLGANPQAYLPFEGAGGVGPIGTGGFTAEEKERLKEVMGLDDASLKILIERSPEKLRARLK